MILALKKLYSAIGIVVLLNLLLKPVWIFCIENKFQHIVGNASYGSFYNIYSITLIGSVLLDAGLSQYFTVHFNNITIQSAKQQIFNLLFIKIILSIAYVIILFCVTSFLGFRNYSILFLLIVQQIITAFIALLRTYFIANQQFVLDGFFSILDRLLGVIVFVILFYFVQFTYITAYQFALLQSITAIITLAIIIFFIGKISFKFHCKSIFNICKKAFPYALLVLCMAILLRSDIVLISVLHKNSFAEAGVYTSGFRLLDALNSFGYIIAAIFFSFVCKNLNNIVLVKKLTQQFSILLIGGAIFCCVFVFMFKQKLSAFLFTQQNSENEKILFYCSVAFIGCCIVHIYGSILTAHQKLFPLITSTIAAIILLFSLHSYFTPIYGALAAAVITAFVQLSYGIGLFIICKFKKLV